MNPNESKGNWLVVDDNGRVIAYGISKEMAEAIANERANAEPDAGWEALEDANKTKEKSAKYITNVTQNGNSLYVKIPKRIRETLKIKKDDNVKVNIRKVE